MKKTPAAITGTHVSVGAIIIIIATFFAAFGSTFEFAYVSGFSVTPFRILLVLTIPFATAASLRSEKENPRHNVQRIVVLSALGWALYSFLSIVWAEDKPSALQASLLLATNLFYVVSAFTLIKTRLERRLFIGAIVVSAGALLGIGVWEMVSKSHLPRSALFGRKYPSMIPTATFVNQNDFATYLTLVLPLLFGVAAWKDGHAIIRIAGFALGALTLYQLFIINSRANLAAVVLQIAVLVVLLVIRVFLKKKIPWRAVVITAVLLVVGWFGFSGPVKNLAGKVEKSISSAITELAREGSSSSVRTNIYRNLLLFTGETQGLGVGAGNVGHWLENYSAFDLRGHNTPHNWWLELLATYGVGIALLYMGFMILAALRFVRKAVTKEDYIVPLIFVVTLAGFVVGVLSPSSLVGFAPHWLLIAALIMFFPFALPKKRSEAAI